MSSVNLDDAMPSTSTVSNIRATKRKFDQAILTLDSAVEQEESRPPPSKKFHQGPRLLLSNIAKYGLKRDSKPKQTTPSSAPAIKTPHLSAILSRSASYLKGSTATTTRAPLSSIASTIEYRPSSTASFLSRLSTFKLSTYSNKHDSLSPAAAAKYGWINDGKDRLLCMLCEASWVVAKTDGLSRDAANALVERQRNSLLNHHKSGCPWKTRQCDDSIYRIPMQTPLAMARHIKARAAVLTPLLAEIDLKHPLNANQVHNLMFTINSVQDPKTTHDDDAQLASSTDIHSIPNHGSISAPASPELRPIRLPDDDSAISPSEAGVLVSLFGWSLAPPAPERSHTSASAYRTSGSISSTSIFQRPSEFAPDSAASSRAASPFPRPSTSMSARSSSQSALQRQPSYKGLSMVASRIPSSAPTRDNALLHCELCQRRIGLWAFALPALSSTANLASSEQSGEQTSAPARIPPRRSFDPLKEHRAYCPYVVRSTVVPSLSILQQKDSNSGASGQKSSEPVEGWRAVLSVLLGYGATQRQRQKRDILTRATTAVNTDVTATLTGEEAPDEEDPVEAMIAGIKSRGGRDVLKYVKSLFV